MAAHDHLGSQFHYHSSPSRNRPGISENGLLLDMDEGYGTTAPGVYMTERPGSAGDGYTSPETDVWRVDTTGLNLEPDTASGEPEEVFGKSVFYPGDVPPERLSLHLRGS